MRNRFEKFTVDTACKPLWMRTLFILLTGMGCAFFALAFFPSVFESVTRLLGQPISNANASENNNFISPAAARVQQLANAKTVVHGMFIKDSYGCAYMFQYLSATLTLTPVLDEHKQQVCDK